YIEEFNRLPEDTLNTLLTAMAERELHIPRYGSVPAAASFRVVAAMNPFDNVGTGRVSVSMYDRLCRMAGGYQSAAGEAEIGRRQTGSTDEQLITLAVEVTRSTRGHQQLLGGASVRGAIDLVLIYQALRAIGAETRNGQQPEDGSALLDAATLAVTSKIVP